MNLSFKFAFELTTFFVPSQLQQGIEDNEHSLVAARNDRQERSMNQLIRQEQDEAYKESLEADQQKEQKRKVELAKREAEEKVKSDQISDERDRRERLLRLKVDLADQIPSEPDASDPNVIRVLIKLPDGTRLERRFARTMSIKYLIYFVFCHAQSPVNFQVTTNFPRKELPCKPPTLDNPNCDLIDADSGVHLGEPVNFEQCGLGKSEMLFVHDLEA